MLVLFWRCILVVSKTLKAKCGASGKFMFSRETCFSSTWLALEFSVILKDQSKVGFGKCPRFIQGVYITQWLNQPRV